MEQKKSSEQIQMERNAEEMERQIIRFTNIDQESFTHSFRGISITIQAGESYVGRLPECDHLATHLARKMISRAKKIGLPKDKGINLWNEKEIADMKEKILSPIATEQSEHYGEAEARKRDVEALANKYDSPKTSAPTKEELLGKIRKQDILKDLSSRGLKPDVTKTKEELLNELMAAEAAGILPKETL